MNDLLQQASSQFGISQDGAGSAIGGMLGMLKDKADPSDFGSLLEKVPGAGDLVGKAASGGGGGGGLGGMLGSVGGMLGGSAGSALGVAGMLKGSGLKMDQAGDFTSMVVGYLKNKAGDGLVGKVLGSAPELMKLVR